MQIRDVMTPRVHIAAPTDSIRDCAYAMGEADVGLLPVAEGDRLVGMVSDRDIAIRGVAGGATPDTPVREVMTAEVRYCFEDQDVDEVAENMADIQVRRLPVINREKQLVGIISLGDIATRASSGAAGTALSGISEKGGRHNQSAGPAAA